MTPSPTTITPPALSIDRLSFGYQGKPALKQLSFSVRIGEFFGLLGPNGAGKSTLMALLTRLLRPDSGDIAIFGQSLQGHPGTAMANMGVVFQQSTLDLDLSVFQNLKYHGALHGLSPRLIYQRIDEELTRFGLQDKRHLRLRQLNGGHRRRVELARALLHRPRLLLLDEPTVGLDVEARASLLRHVRQLCTDQGLAVLWTTHLIDELQRDDSLLVLHQGQSLAQGTASVLLARHDQPSIAGLFEHLTRSAP